MRKVYTQAVDDLSTLPLEPPFVGRLEEMGILAAALQDVVRGIGRAILVSGEPGIGKTRLARHFSDLARTRGVNVLWGRCWETGGAPPYWPWLEVVQSLLATGSDTHGFDTDSLLQLLHATPDCQSTELSTSFTVTSDATRFRLFHAMASLLRSSSQQAPLVIVIDDLQMADRPSLALLSFLARALIDSRVLLLGTHRDVDPRIDTYLRDSLAQLGCQGHKIDLSGLTSQDVRELVRTLRNDADDIAGSIYAATAGNPLFVGELLRMIATEQGLSGVSTAPFKIPARITDAVRLRLGAISTEARHLLDTAAVIGREFDLALLASVVGRSASDALNFLEEPLRYGLVVDLRPGHYAFRHTLIRDVLYEDLSSDRRLRLHEQVGLAIATRVSTDGHPYHTQCAHHLLIAAPLSRDYSFVEHAVRAAEHAMMQMAFEDAVALYQRTLDAVATAPRDDRRQCLLLLGLGRAQEWSGHLEGSRESFRRAARIARSIRAIDLLVEAALGVGAVLSLKFVASSRCEAAPDLLREALAAVPIDDSGRRARLLSRLALHGCFNPAATDAVALSAEAVRLGRASGDPNTLVHALAARHGVLVGASDLPERYAIAREILNIATKMNSSEFAMRGYALAITDLTEIGDIIALDDALAAHQQLSSETGDSFERWANLVWRAMRAMLDGRFDYAKQLAHEAFDFATRVSGPYSREIYAQLSFSGQKILIDELCGETAPDVVNHFRELRERYPESVTLRAAPAFFLSRAGRLDDARQELFALSRNGFAELPQNVTWLFGICLLAEAVHYVNDRDWAESLYRLLLPYHDRNVSISVVACFGSAHRFLGLLAATCDRWQDAARHFEEALCMNGRMGARPFVALTSYDYARLIPIEGDALAHKRALALAEEALRIARDIGMKRLARDTEELRRRLLKAAAHNGLPANRNSALPQLTKEGEVWILTGHGERTLLKDSKGLQYLAELLRRPGDELHALELVRLTAPPPEEGVYDESLEAREADFQAEIVDARARRAYKKRINELTCEFERATAAGDPEKATILHDELTKLRDEERRIFGLGDRPRRSGDAERARLNVTRTIRLALLHVLDAAPAVGAHLARSIHTGTFCSYAPEGELERGVGPVVAAAPSPPT